MKGTAKGAGTDIKGFAQTLAACLPAAPALIFIAGMAAELYKCLVAYNTYFNDIVPVTRWAVLTGLLAIALRLFARCPGGGMKTAVLNNPAVLCFSAMLILMLLSTLRNGFTDQALFGDLYRSESLFSFIVYLTIYYFVSSLIDSERVKHVLLNGLLAVVGLVAAASLLQLAAIQTGIPFFSLPYFKAGHLLLGVVGIYQNANHYGYVLALSVALSGALFACTAKVLARSLYLALFMLFTAVLVLNDTFGSWLAAFSALLFLISFFLVRDKKLRCSTVILLGIFIAVSHITAPGQVLNNVSILSRDTMYILGNVQGHVSSTVAGRAGTGRLKLWKASASLILQRPILGYGVDGIAAPLTAEFGKDRPHNEFLQYAAFFGIPALLCYLSALFSVWSNFWKQRHTASVCTIAAFTAAFGYLVSSCFGNTMYYTTPLFFIMLGLADAYPPQAAAGDPS